MKAGEKHTYRIRAKNSNKTGNWSGVFNVVTAKEAPAVPKNIKTKAEKSKITICWDKVNNADNYDVEVDGVIINKVINTQYIHNNLIPKSEHIYRVRAINGGGNSPWSDVEQQTIIMTF